MDTTPEVAPAAPAESAPAQEPVSQTPAPAGEGEQAPPEPRKPSRTQQRIDELTRQRYEEQRGREAAEARLAQVERERVHTQQFSQLDTEEPKVDQYNSLAEYGRALSDWSAKRAALMATAAWERRAQEQYAQQQEQFARQQQEQFQQAQVQAVVESRMEVGRKKYADFMDVVTNPDLPPIRQHGPLFGALMACENAHDIAYALAKNPAEYERFYAMRNPWQISRELTLLDQKFTGSGATTGAPPPPPQRKGTSAGSRTWEDMSTAEHVKAYLGRKR
jgi:hypothetical protein